MAKGSIVGIDMGYDQLKLVLIRGNEIQNIAVVPMPDKMIKDGRVVSVEAMGELIKNTMKEYDIRCKNAAVVLPGENVFIRNVTMPIMTEKQLMYNLPYEFHDYILTDLNDYLFDYAMISTEEELKERCKRENEQGEKATMDLQAVAVSKKLMEDYREILRRAGMRLVSAAPSISAFGALIRDYEEEYEAYDEYCILDLGSKGIRMYMYEHDLHKVTRELDIGISNLNRIVADLYSVDIHLAHTYLMNNHDGCQTKAACMESYNRFAIELRRALNFYQFSNPGSQLHDIWICGGGAKIKPLVETLKENFDMDVHTISSLLVDEVQDSDISTVAQAIGVALN